MPTTDDKKVIYSMHRVSKKHGTKQVLKDISLSYFYGAKIGVIGLNGSGKSSLLRILAGRDSEFAGETSASPGYAIGFLEQEPELQAGKTVREIVREGAGEVSALLAEFDRAMAIEVVVSLGVTSAVVVAGSAEDERVKTPTDELAAVNELPAAVGLATAGAVDPDPELLPDEPV